MTYKQTVKICLGMCVADTFDYDCRILFRHAELQLATTKTIFETKREFYNGIAARLM